MISGCRPASCARPRCRFVPVEKIWTRDSKPTTALRGKAPAGQVASRLARAYGLRRRAKGRNMAGFVERLKERRKSRDEYRKRDAIARNAARGDQRASYGYDPQASPREGHEDRAYKPPMGGTGPG
jgi:hypothetical protein